MSRQPDNLSRQEQVASRGAELQRNVTELDIGQDTSEEESIPEHSAVNPANSEENPDGEDSGNHMDEEQSVAGNVFNRNANFDDTKVEVEMPTPENSQIAGNFKQKVPISRTTLR